MVLIALFSAALSARVQRLGCSFAIIVKNPFLVTSNDTTLNLFTLVLINYDYYKRFKIIISCIKLGVFLNWTLVEGLQCRGCGAAVACLQ